VLVKSFIMSLIISQSRLGNKPRGWGSQSRGAELLEEVNIEWTALQLRDNNPGKSSIALR